MMRSRSYSRYRRIAAPIATGSTATQNCVATEPISAEVPAASHRPYTSRVGPRGSPEGRDDRRYRGTGCRPSATGRAMDNDELIAAVAAGDDAALRELFSRHAPWLAARLRAVLPAADVEDVLQETFLAAWRGAAGYRQEGGGGWLWGIARRQAALWLRRRGHAELLLPALVAADGRRPRPAGLRLVRLYLASRRTLTCLLVLVA